MIEHPLSRSGLDLVLETFDRRFLFDANGRIERAQNGGVSPRFVLGRCAEGCVWRFRGDLESDLVASIAKLAGREPGIPIAGETPAPPERLAMIERLLGVSAKGLSARCESLRRDGVCLAELWTVE